ncbi:MAG: hypothetical protein HC837_20415 [Chloroflexaceae bacterium]|nr:hypothetical protein [Chloroflexaceae bacterium]
MVHSVEVIARRAIAYIPTLAKGEAKYGPYIAVEPVYITPLTVDAVLGTLEQVIAAGHPFIETPQTPEDWRNWRKIKDPVLAAMKLKNESQMVKESAYYHIAWTEDGIVLYLHTLEKEGRRVMFSFDPENRAMAFPHETPLRPIIEAIFADMKTLPARGHVDVLTPA